MAFSIIGYLDAKLSRVIRFQKMKTDFIIYVHLLILQRGFLIFVTYNFNIKI